MRYTVTEEHHDGGIDLIWRGESVATAITEGALAARERSPQSHVYVEWFRDSDGQRGYLNPNGDHDVAGKSW